MTPLPLEPDDATMDELGQAALSFARTFVAERAAAPASDLEPDDELLRDVRDLDTVLDVDAVLDLVRRGAAKGFDTAGPGYVAYIPGGGLYTAAVADLLACVTNRFVNLAAPAPVFAAMEAAVLDWMGAEFGLPPGRRSGILTSGGSMSILSALAAARTAVVGDDARGARLYVSEQAHHAIEKASRIVGLPSDAVHVVACDSALRMDPDALATAIAADRAAGRRPFCVVASAGTTNTGALDPIEAVADAAAAEGLWLHVDGAYGGFFQLTARGRERLAGVERADSITLDPHKGMFLPYGTGALLVRDGETLRAAHAGHASYLQDIGGSDGIPDYAHLSPELSRDFRGLRVWLPLRLHGRDAFRDGLDEKLDLAELVAERLSAVSELEVPWAPDLSIVAFHHRGGDEASRRLLDSVNRTRRAFLSSTVVADRFTLRICILSHRTHRDRVEEILDIVTEGARRISAG